MRAAAEEAVARGAGEGGPSVASHREERRGDRHHAEVRGLEDQDQAGRALGVPAPARPKPVRDGARLQEALVEGARALDRGYEREALRSPALPRPLGSPPTCGRCSG